MNLFPSRARFRGRHHGPVLCHVSDLALHPPANPVSHPSPHLTYEAEDILGRSVSEVYDEIRMNPGYFRISYPRSLEARLFHDSPGGPRQFVDPGIVRENRTAVGQLERELAPSFGEDPKAFLPDGGRGLPLQNELDFRHNPHVGGIPHTRDPRKILEKGAAIGEPAFLPGEIPACTCQ